MYHKYTGVILKKFPLNEADELVTIYTREHGKMRTLARSVRQIQSKLAGSLQSLNEIEFEVARRRPRFGGQGPLPIIISIRAKTVNNYLRENLKKFAHALVGVETLYRLTPDEEQNAPAYDLLSGFLRSLGESREENLLVRRFQLSLLDLFGYRFPGEVPEKLGPAAEREIDEFLNYVLEREIKAKKFIDSLT